MTLHWTPVAFGFLLAAVPFIVLASLVWIPILVRQWRRARHVIAVTEAEAEAQAMAQANAGHCPVCSKHPGNGPCVCVSVCGHPDCVGDHTSMAGLTAADVRWLRQVSIKGDE